MSSRRLHVVLDLDTGRYTGRMNSAANITRRFGGVVDQSSRGVRQFSRSFDTLNSAMSTPLQKLRDYVLILGNIRLAILNVRDIAVGWVGAMLQQSAQVERLTMLMKGLSQATDDVARSQEAARNMQFLFQEARRTGFAVDALADAFVKMKSGGVDPMDGSLRSLSNAVANFGGTSDVMHRASIAIQQMSGKGVISMEELRQQLGEAVPTAMADMSRAMGMSVKEFTDLVSKGVVQAKPALELMFREFDRLYGGAGERMASTLSGQMAIFKTNLMELSTIFTGLQENGEGRGGGLFDGAKTALEQINAAMQSSEGKAFVKDLGDAVASVLRGLMAVGGFIVRFRNEIGVALKAVLAGFVAFQAVNVFGWMIGAARAATASLGAAFAQMGATIRSFGTATAQSSNVAQTAMTGLAARLSQTSTAMSRLTAIQQARAVSSQRNLVIAQQESAQATQRLAQLRAEQAALTQKIAAERAAIAQARQQQTVAQANIATNVRMSQSIQQLRAAKTAETLASIRLSQAERQLVVTKSQVSQAARAATVAITAETAAVGRATVANTTATIGYRAKAVAIGIAAAATRALSVAVNLLLGPLGMIATALYFAAEAAGVFENRANRAADAAARLRAGIASIEDIEQVNKRREELLKEQKKDRKLLESGGHYETAYGEMGPQRIWVEHNKEDKDRIRRRMQKRAEEDRKLQRDAAYGAGSLMEQEGRQGADRVQSRINDRLRPLENDYKEKVRTGASQAEIDASAERLARARKAANDAALDEIAQRRRAAIAAGNQSEVKALDAMADQLRVNNGITGELEQSTEDLRAAAVGAGEGGSAAGKKAAAGMSEAERATSRYNDMIAQQSVEIAVLESELSGAETALAKFEAEVKAGLFPHASQEQLDKMRQNFAEIDRLTSERDWGRSLRQLRKEVVQATADANGLWRALMADETGRAFEKYERVESVRARFADKIEQAAGDPKRMAEVNAEIEQMISSLDRIDAARAVDGWRQMTEEIHISLMSEDEARQANFDREVERQRQMLDIIRNNANTTAEERIRAELRFDEWRRMKQQQLERESERHTTKMARDWAKLGTNIDRALGGALESFVDGMFDAQFSFKDFAVGLIKELVKIILKAMIAYAILSALGLANNSSGQKVSFGDFMKGQISGGFGGNVDPKTNIGFGAGSNSPGKTYVAPTAHVGGIIGRLSQSATVDPAVFAKAKSYHTGTNSIGGRPLRPGEVPMIGLEGEAVLTEDHQAMISARLRQGPGAPPPVTVNVINNSGQQLEAEQGEPEFNGKEMIVNVVVEAAQKQGPLRDVLSSMAKQ